MDIIFVTGNANKAREAERILGIGIETSDLDIHEIQAIDVEEVVKDKAIRAFDILKKPLIVEDTGLYFKDFNGFPGALIKWMIKNMGRDNMARLFSGREVVAEACICYYDGNEMEIFKGSIDGKISQEPMGGSGFGWDPIFIPKNSSRTFAEMSAEEKNAISHRGKAFSEFKKWIEIRRKPSC